MTSRSFPERPIRLIVGASPGSASDILARALIPALSQQLRQPVTMESHQRENGVPAGARLVAASPPDGYTLFLTTLSMQVVAPLLDSAPPYHPLDDFSPVSLIARCPLLLAVHPSVAARSVSELTLLAREQPGSLTFASSAIGGSPHLAAALYMAMANVDMKHVCYDRTEQLFADLVSGRLALSFNNIMSILPLLPAGKLRGLAVTSATRSALAPDLPTMAESGFDGYEVTNWLGIVAPAGVDAKIIATLNAAISGALQSGGIARELAPHGMECVASSASQFEQHIRSELAKWGPLVQKSIAKNAA